MKRVRDFTIETAHALFELKIFAAEDGNMCRAEIEKMDGRILDTTERRTEQVGNL